MTQILLYIITALLVATTAACEKTLPLQLTGINSIADSISGAGTNADRELFHRADSLLSSVDVSGLSENDRMYHSLLQVKLTDKAYLRHPGDTIICPVVEYAEKHRRCGFYTEALYYGGRVYSDIGDSFTALRYYQDALDNLPDEKRNTLLHAKILSQTGRLLYSLRLNEEAAQYLKGTIRIDSILGEPLLKVYDTELLASIFLHQNNYGMAKATLEKARQLAMKVSPLDTAIIDVNLAEILYHQGKIPDALRLIRPAVEATDSLSKNLALANASRIYKEAGVLDTAAIYALRLVNRKDPNNHKIGYRVIFSPEMKDVIPHDTLTHYIGKYHSWMENYLDRNGDSRAISQQSLYNYRIHQTMAAKTKHANSILWIVIVILSVVIFGAILTICALLIKLNTHKRGKKLHDSRHNEIVDTSSSSMVASATDLITEKQDETDYATQRERLLNKLLEKINDPGFIRETELSITQSPIYNELKEMLRDKSTIVVKEETWEKIRETVHSVSPNFDKHLDLIMETPPEIIIRRVAYLVKFGFGNSQIGDLVMRSASSITSYRRQMSRCILGDEKEYKKVDDLLSIL